MMKYCAWYIISKFNLFIITNRNKHERSSQKLFKFSLYIIIDDSFLNIIRAKMFISNCTLLCIIFSHNLVCAHSLIFRILKKTLNHKNVFFEQTTDLFMCLTFDGMIQTNAKLEE